ncbi:MAG: rhamnulokinase [Phycisphaerae bacterium]|nr:rhamnulokinase [Phycisphaerae bacterium]
MSYYLAVDLGAESGRIILGTLADEKLALDELHRFPSATVRLPGGTFRWDVLQIYNEIKRGLSIAAKKGVTVNGISVDSWGVDYVLINDQHPQLIPPFHYRDARNEPSMQRVRAQLGDAEIFNETGIQFLPFNTIYQLAADQQDSPGLLALATVFLTMADYFNYLLSGVPCIDQSLASTTQLYNPRTKAWCDSLIEKLSLPRRIFPRIVPPATKIGPMRSDVAEECGLRGVQVIATCSHDTGAAIVAVPANEFEDQNWGYLISGTWSLLGVELSGPLINDRVREANFTNEAGYNGTSRFLKNIVGLWILQECRRSWDKKGQSTSYADLTREAAAAQPFRSLIHPDDPRFAAPGQMPEKIIAFCTETDQPIPETPAQFTRCILESLALLYRDKVDELESLTRRSVDRLHVVGGGAQSDLLNQFTASALDAPVFAGPVEGSAIGNVLVQAMALGHVRDLPHLRAIVARSFGVKNFQPADAPSWQTARQRFARFKMKQ